MRCLRISVEEAGHPNQVIKLHEGDCGQNYLAGGIATI
jgi:hypothetical protein